MDVSLIYNIERMTRNIISHVHEYEKGREVGLGVKVESNCGRISGRMKRANGEGVESR